MDESQKARLKTNAEHAGTDVGQAVGVTAEVLAHGLAGAAKGLAEGIEDSHSHKGEMKNKEE